MSFVFLLSAATKLHVAIFSVEVAHVSSVLSGKPTQQGLPAAKLDFLEETSHVKGGSWDGKATAGPRLLRFLP